jgi:AICAR transformylase/IMP cyclohydrolase PurH
VSSGLDSWECAYGENGWQVPARFVPERSYDPLAIGRFALLEGSPLSYNNVIELDRQLQTITHIAAAFDLAGAVPAIAIGTKHGNACGAGVADGPVAATQLMLSGDVRAIFGGCVMLGFGVDKEVATTLVSHASEGRRLLDLVAAASFSDEAVEILARKHGKCRVLANPALEALSRASLDTGLLRRRVRGGVLEQPNYKFVLDLADPAVQRIGTLAPSQERDLLLAWARLDEQLEHDHACARWPAARQRNWPTGPRRELRARRYPRSGCWSRPRRSGCV